MFFVTAVLTFLISYFLSSFFKKGIYFLLIFFALIVLNIQILSLFKMICGLNIFILTVFEAISTFILWFISGKPLIKLDCSTLKRIKTALAEDKSLLILAVFWIFLIAVSFILAAFSPVNEPDAQGYHALRALFFANDGFLHHFETADVRALVMPFNSELFYTWVFCLSKNDCTVGLLSFFSYFLLIISSFKIMKIFDIEDKNALWAIFIFSSLAGVISQISSTQTDLIVGALFSLSLYLILLFKRENKVSILYFSALSIALSFGVKSTGVIGSVPLIIYYICLLKDKKSDILKFFLFLGLNFIVFSSYNYILNFVDFGNFLGAKSALIGHGFWGGAAAVFANFIRYIFQFFDFAGFSVGFYLNPHLLWAQNFIIQLFHIPSDLGVNVPLNFTNISMTEQVLGFGVLGFLVLLPASIFALFKKDRIFSIIFWAQIFVLSCSIAYMIYSIRFIVSFAAILIPVISVTYSKKMNIYKFIIILFAFFYMCYASLFLSQRPFYYLLKQYKNGDNLYTVQENMRDLNYKFYPSFNEAYTMKNEVKPYCKNNNKIGIFVSNGYMLYSTKYLELNNDCKIDTLNALHLEHYNLSGYDLLITQKSIPQKIEAINKKDILNPVVPNRNLICYYIGMNQNRQKYTLSYFDIKDSIASMCMINPEYIKEHGFRQLKEIEADMPDYLKARADETVKDFIIWGK